MSSDSEKETRLKAETERPNAETDALVRQVLYLKKQRVAALKREVAHWKARAEKAERELAEDKRRQEVATFLKGYRNRYGSPPW